MPVIQGQTSDLRAFFPNASGTLQDPDHVHLEVVNPSQIAATYVYAASSVEIKRAATGIYDANFIYDQPGEWDWKWIGTGSLEGITDGLTLVRAPYTQKSSVATNAYADLAAVQALQPGRKLTASSTPNTMEVAGFLTMTAAELDGILRSRGYIAPITATYPEARELMVYGNSLGGAALVEQSAVSHGQGKPPAAVTLWENFKKALQDGKMMPDAPKDTTISGVRHGKVASAFFTRCMDE